MWSSTIKSKHIYKNEYFCRNSIKLRGRFYSVSWPYDVGGFNRNVRDYFRKQTNINNCLQFSYFIPTEPKKGKEKIIQCVSRFVLAVFRIQRDIHPFLWNPVPIVPNVLRSLFNYRRIDWSSTGTGFSDFTPCLPYQSLELYTWTFPQHKINQS